MADKYEIAHRFANRQFGKYGTLKCGNVSCDERDYFSYSTVFGQWVDIDKKICLAYFGPTSSSSSRHQLGGCFPDDVTVFPYSDGGGMYGYAGCSLLGWRQDKWEATGRYMVIKYYMKEILAQFRKIQECKKYGCEKISLEYFELAKKIISLYKDTSWKGFLEFLKCKMDDELIKFTKTLRYAASRMTGLELVKYVTNKMFGAETFEKYWKYCERFRKTEHKRHLGNKIKEHLGISYYDDCLTWGKAIKLTAKERVQIKLAREISKLQPEHRDTFNNWKKWLFRSDKFVSKNEWEIKVAQPVIINDELIFTTGYDNGASKLQGLKDWQYEFATKLYISRDEFSKYKASANKEQWLSEFYDNAVKVAKTNMAIKVLSEWGEIEQLNHYRISDYNFYKLADGAEKNLSAEELTFANEFIANCKTRLHEMKVADRMRAIEMARQQAEKEREEKLRREASEREINELLSQGIEGLRMLWRKHYRDSHVVESLCKNYGNELTLYHGGNVLLRFNTKHDEVQTSKNVHFTIDTAKKFWPLINKWHNNPDSFKPKEIKTLSGTYNISSYENDILTAGCHKIAYCEMERMWNEINNNIA